MGVQLIYDLNAGGCSVVCPINHKARTILAISMNTFNDKYLSNYIS